MLVAVVTGITIIATIFITPAPVVTDQVNGTKKTEIVKTEVDKTKDPQKFPAGVPIETGAKITQNYNATAPDGRFQATKAFETAKTLADNFTLYQKYMKDSGWDIQSTVNQDNYKALFGVKGSTNLQVSMNNNTNLKIKTITISYTEIPVAPAK